MVLLQPTFAFAFDDTFGMLNRCKRQQSPPDAAGEQATLPPVFDIKIAQKQQDSADSDEPSRTIARDQVSNYGPSPPEYYPKEPEPIIEIIIKESNESLPTPAPLPPPPTIKPTQGPVEVFYVNYQKKKNYGGQGDRVVYDPPIPALLPVEDHEEVKPDNYNQAPLVSEENVEEATPSPREPSTTLRTVIHPESEMYNSGNSGILVTFGSESLPPNNHKKRSESRQEENNGEIADDTPVGDSEASTVRNHQTIYVIRRKTPQRPFDLRQQKAANQQPKSSNVAPQNFSVLNKQGRLHNRQVTSYKFRPINNKGFNSRPRSTLPDTLVPPKINLSIRRPVQAATSASQSHHFQQQSQPHENKEPTRSIDVEIQMQNVSLYKPDYESLNRARVQISPRQNGPSEEEKILLQEKEYRQKLKFYKEVVPSILQDNSKKLEELLRSAPEQNQQQPLPSSDDNSRSIRSRLSLALQELQLNRSLANLRITRLNLLKQQLGLLSPTPKGKLHFFFNRIETKV